MERKEYIKQIKRNLDKKEKLDFFSLSSNIKILESYVSCDWKANNKEKYGFNICGGIYEHNYLTKETWFDELDDKTLMILLSLSYFDLDLLHLISNLNLIYVACKKLQIVIKELNRFIGTPQSLYDTVRTYERFVNMFYTLGLVEEKIDKIESAFPEEFLPYSCYKEKFNNLNNNWLFAENGKIENLFFEVEKMKKKENKKNE